MKVVRSRNLGADRFYIQSFDVRPLQYVKKRYPKIAIGFLTSSKSSLGENIKELGFLPHIYSPNYSLVNADLIAKVHENRIKIVPWTVNTKEEIQKLVNLGVDGIITDYPDYLVGIK